MVVYSNIGQLSSKWYKVFAQKFIKEAPVFPRWQENVPPHQKDRMNLACPEMSCSYSKIRSRQVPRAKLARVTMSPCYWEDHQGWIFQSVFNRHNILCKRTGWRLQFTAALLQISFCLSLSVPKQIARVFPLGFFFFFFEFLNFASLVTLLCLFFYIEMSDDLAWDGSKECLDCVSLSACLDRYKDRWIYFIYIYIDRSFSSWKHLFEI